MSSPLKIDDYSQNTCPSPTMSVVSVYCCKNKKNIKKQKIKFEHLWKIGDERNVEGHELHRSGDNKSSPGDLTKNQSKHYIHGTFEIGFRSK